MTQNAFTPDQLGARWSCSAETVRSMIKQNKLFAFKVGRMFRIPSGEVERYEQCKHLQSGSSRKVSQSLGQKEASVAGFVCRHARSRKPKQKHAK